MQIQRSRTNYKIINRLRREDDRRKSKDFSNNLKSGAHWEKSSGTAPDPRHVDFESQTTFSLLEVIHSYHHSLFYLSLSNTTCSKILKSVLYRNSLKFSLYHFPPLLSLMINKSANII